MSALSPPYLCPSCRSHIDSETLVCGGNHAFVRRDGVLVLLDSVLAARLESFNEALRIHRDEIGRRLLDPEVYDRLPYGEAEGGDFEWRLRVWDLSVLNRLLAGGGRREILDIGSHNGWLDRHLADAGHLVTGVDYFDDEHDGLRARRFYRLAAWTSIQMDLRDLSILNRRYDVVILNRCLQFFPDPHAYVEQQVKPLVRSPGLLVATGLDFHRRPERKRSTIEELRRRHLERFGIDFFLHPTRGYLDFVDRDRLRAAGLEIRTDRRLWLRNLQSILQPSRPRSSYGVWRKTRASS